MPTQLVVPAGQDPVGGPDRRFGVGGGVAAHVGKPLGRGVGSRPPHVYRFGSLMNARNRFPAHSLPMPKPSSWASSSKDNPSVRSWSG
jgi:hypothetical protein